MPKAAKKVTAIASRAGHQTPVLCAIWSEKGKANSITAMIESKKYMVAPLSKLPAARQEPDDGAGTPFKARQAANCFSISGSVMSELLGQ
jgi:hypothetical protein